MRRGVATFVIVLLVVMLNAVVLVGEPNCADEMLQLWNTFAADANSYTHTLDVDRDKRANRKRRLNQEWERLNRCECW